MNKFYSFLYKWLQKKIYPHWCENCLECKRQEIFFDFLLSHANRKTRRKWWRMTTRKHSPFYIGGKNV